MSSDIVVSVKPLGFPWETSDPFLFCVHHDDAYPKGNEQMGPEASLDGRNIGQDFEGIDGWRMYHGDVVPGFPQHPHRGFETVTIVRQGYIDHSDSLGATARFGSGDVQWLTAGKGIVHSEMFPLRERDRENPAELFQIWLNLPKKHKFADPHFTMLWDNTIPKQVITDEAGHTTNIAVVAGQLGNDKAPPPPPQSWAASIDNDVAIWTIRMDAEASITLPKASKDATRTLYFFMGGSVTIGDQSFSKHAAIQVRADVDVKIQAGSDVVEILMLQGKPIGEPVVQYGPFVMNTRAEIQQAMADYQRTRFGGWPWPSDGPVHAREDNRFAKHADGRVEKI